MSAVDTPSGQTFERQLLSLGHQPRGTLTRAEDAAEDRLSSQFGLSGMGELQQEALFVVQELSVMNRVQEVLHLYPAVANLRCEEGTTAPGIDQRVKTCAERRELGHADLPFQGQIIHLADHPFGRAEIFSREISHRPGGGSVPRMSPTRLLPFPA